MTLAPGGEHAVECAGLAVRFGRHDILRGVDLSVARGGIAALVGPCGAGKTTLIKALAGLVPVSEGTIRVCGRPVSARSPRTRRDIGFAPAEERSFYWRLSGRENLRFFASLHGLGGRERSSRIEELLAEVGLAGRAELRFQEYSSGMRQALGVARALLHAPPLLLLDEPTRSLSPELARRIRALLVRTAREGAALVIASHNLREVEEIADCVLVMDRGRVRASGPPARLEREAGLPGGAGLEAVFEHFTGG